MGQETSKVPADYITHFLHLKIKQRKKNPTPKSEKKIHQTSLRAWKTSPLASEPSQWHFNPCSNVSTPRRSMQQSHVNDNFLSKPCWKPVFHSWWRKKTHTAAGPSWQPFLVSGWVWWGPGAKSSDSLHGVSLASDFQTERRGSFPSSKLHEEPWTISSRVHNSLQRQALKKGSAESPRPLVH